MSAFFWNSAGKIYGYDLKENYDPQQDKDLEIIVRSIEELPEYKNADTRVEVRYGSAKNEAGRWSLVVAAGTNGGFPIAKAYFDYGVSTVIYLHIDYNDLMKMYEEKLKGNLQHLHDENTEISKSESAASSS